MRYMDIGKRIIFNGDLFFFNMGLFWFVLFYLRIIKESFCFGGLMLNLGVIVFVFVFFMSKYILE